MTAAGYDQPPASEGPPPGLPTAVKRYSNAHIVELLEKLQCDVDDVRSLLLQGSYQRPGQ
jgi:hypothetical protein